MSHNEELAQKNQLTPPQNPPEPTLSVHAWTSLQDLDGAPFPDLPFGQVVAWLTGGTLPPEGGLSFAAFGFTRSDKGSLRHIANVQTVHALAIDVDGGASLESVDRVFAPYGRLTYETKRSTIAEPRCRVVVPLAEPATPEHYRQIAKAYLDRLRAEQPGASLDEKATCDPSRFWFPPRAANGRTPRHLYAPGPPLPLPPYNPHAKTAGTTPKNRRKAPPRGWVSHLEQADGTETSHDALRASAAAWVAQGAPPAHDEAWITAVLDRVSRWPADCPAHRAARSVDRVYLEAFLTSARAKFEIPESDRPTIELGPDVHRVADQTCEHLQNAELYQRGGALTVTLQRLEPSGDPSEPPRPQLYLKQVDEHSLRIMISRLVRFSSRNANGDYSFKPPPIDVVRAILNRGSWPVPPIRGLAETPILHQDGTVHARPGYDTQTAYYLDAPTEYAILDPTQDMAQQALAFLFEPFSEFEVEEPSDRYVPIAAILTMLARPLIDNVPVFAIDATVMGSGKTLAADAISTIATGHITAKTQFPFSAEEQEKVLGALALQGNILVAFDNIDRPIFGEPLERVLTSRGKVALRVLGRSEAPTLPWAPVFLFTGNQLAVAGDMRRRVIRFRIVPSCERPSERSSFRYPNLLKHVRESRADYVSAGLTLLSAYLRAGAPCNLKMQGSFEQWIQIVAGAIAWAGGPDVTRSWWHLSGTGDDDDSNAQFDFVEWLATKPDGLESPAIVQALMMPDANDEKHQRARAALPILLHLKTNEQPTPRTVGAALRRLRDRVIGGYRVRATKGAHRRINWKVTHA